MNPKRKFTSIQDDPNQQRTDKMKKTATPSNQVGNSGQLRPTVQLSPMQPPPIQTTGSPPILQPTQQPPGFDFTRIDVKESVNEMGLWQMSEKRVDSLENQLPGFLKQNNPKSTDIRIKAQTLSTENWGVSADENVRTQFQRDKRPKMRKKEAEMSFNQRSHQGTLVWKTDSPSLSQYGDKTDTSLPLSSHTPGIKSQNVPGTKGAMTKEHGTRDNRRQEIVSKTFEDPQRQDSDLPIMSKLATVQLFMSPKEELETTRQEVQSGKPVFSIFKDIGDISNPKSGGFDTFTEVVQTVRETDKMHIAKNLLVSGYDSLVPKQHRDLLSKTKGDVDEAMELLRKESSSNQPSFTFNTGVTSQTPRLDQQSLREMSQDKNLKQPPLSPPRRVKNAKFDFN